MKLNIDPSERWIILGKTGSGKSEYAKYLLRIIAKSMPVIIVDVNETWLGKGKGGQKADWAGRREKGSVDRPHLVSKLDPKWHVQCIQPDVDGTEADATLVKMCYEILHKGNYFVYFDESEGIATATHVPQHIRYIWKRGRAHNIGAWVSTQAPKGIPRIFKSQAENFVTFKVGDEDADYVSELVHATADEVQSLKPFEWIYYNTKMDRGERQSPIPYKGK